MDRVETLKKQLIAISRLFYERQWSLATSGNYSARLTQNRILITATSKDKGELDEKDFVDLDLSQGATTDRNASAEALVHCALYIQKPEIGCVLHTHSMAATLLSPPGKAEFILKSYEMLKALRDVTTHQHRERIPIFSNLQDRNQLAKIACEYLSKRPEAHAFLISQHGLYTWGDDISEAKRHVEALEFLLECEYRKLIIKL